MAHDHSGHDIKVDYHVIYYLPSIHIRKVRGARHLLHMKESLVSKVQIQ